jgi:hypothetical protein
MILAVFLAALILLFILVRHNVGVPFLAMIAGVAVYESWGEKFCTTITDWLHIPELSWVQCGMYALLVLVFPLLLYLRAGKSGLFGVLRIAESVVFATVLTIMMADTIASFFTFDTLAYNMAEFLGNIRGVAMIVGISAAYVDVFLFHSGRTW